MDTRKIKEIVKFDVERNIQNKGFIIFNILLLLVMIFMVNKDSIIGFLDKHNMNFMAGDEISIEVLDPENLLTQELEKEFKDTKDFKIKKVEKNEYSKEKLPKNNVVLIEVAKDEKELIATKIVSKESVDGQILGKISNSIKESKNKIFINIHQIGEEDLKVLENEPKIEKVYLGVDAKNSDFKVIIKTASILIVYFALLLVTAQISGIIAQEKTSKSIEYVLTSVTSKEYLLAKVLGVTLTVLIQGVFTLIYYLIASSIKSIIGMNLATTSTLAVEKMAAPKIDMDIVKYILCLSVYLILTIFIVALIQATLTSKTTSIAEASNTTAIIIYLVILLYFISLGLISPYKKVSILMYIISCIPIVSTFFIPSMMIIGQTTTIQIIISFVLLILSVPFIFNICAKHFKNGILDYTSKKKKNKKEKVQLTLREKQEIDLKKKTAKKFAFSIGMSIMTFIISQAILNFIFSLILPAMFKNVLDLNTITMLQLGLVTILSILASSGIIKLYNEKETEKPEPIKGRYVFIGIAFIGIFQLISVWLSNLLGKSEGILQIAEIAPTANSFISNLIFYISIAVIPAIFEELYCRKAILNSAKKYGNFFAIVFSALIFGAIHMNLEQGIFAFLIGIVFAVIAVKTNSIKIPILLHFLNNSYSALQIIFEKNTIVLGIINVIAISLFVFSIIVLIKNLKKVKEFKKEDFKISKDVKYIFINYSFIIAIILLVVMFWSTELFISKI